MTGIFYVVKPDGTKIEIESNLIIDGKRGKAHPYFEAYDFYANGELLNMIYDAVCLMKTGQKIEIVCELEE